MGVMLVLLAMIASSGCDFLFNLDRVDRTTADGSTSNGDADGTGPARLVFVTSLPIRGNMGGLAGADAFCQVRAVQGTLPGTFKAWLSTSTESPATRMAHSDGPYVLVNGTVVASSWADLTDGMIRVPINIDELGQGALGDYVCANGELWSNTDAGGYLHLPGANCVDWTSDAAAGDAARVTQTDAGWTVPSCPSVACSTPMSIYCFQQ